MSVEAISSVSFRSEDRPKCMVCDDPPHIEFNWRYAQENKSNRLHSFVENLKRNRRISFTGAEEDPSTSLGMTTLGCILDRRACV